MLTVNDIFNRTMDLIDERTKDGSLNESKVAVYKARTPGLLNILQNELVKNGEMYKTVEFNRIPVYPIIGQQEYMEHRTEDVIIDSNKPANAYYFESQGPATIYIEEFTDIWNTLQVINIASDKDTLEPYKGLINSSYNASKTRIRFTGDFRYVFTNVALFEDKFSDVKRVPDYRPYVKLEMPEDFKHLTQMIEETFPSGYTKQVDYYWEDKNLLYVSYDFRGNIRLKYKPVPKTLTALTEEIQIDDVIAMATLPYGLSALLMVNENTDLASFHQQKYDEGKIDAIGGQVADESEVTDFYDTEF